MTKQPLGGGATAVHDPMVGELVLAGKFGPEMRLGPQQVAALRALFERHDAEERKVLCTIWNAYAPSTPFWSQAQIGRMAPETLAQAVVWAIRDHRLAEPALTIALGWLRRNEFEFNPNAGGAHV